MGITKISTLTGTASTTGEYNLFGDEKMINRIVGLIEKVAEARPAPARPLVPKSEMRMLPAAQPAQPAPAPAPGAAPAPKAPALALDEAGAVAAMDAVIQALERLSDDNKKHSVNTIIMAYKMNIDGQRDKIRGSGIDFLRAYGPSIFKVE